MWYRAIGALYSHMEFKENPEQAHCNGIQRCQPNCLSYLLAVNLEFIIARQCALSLTRFESRRVADGVWGFCFCLFVQALADVTDFQISQELIKGREDNSFYKSCVSEMLRMVVVEGCTTKKQVLNYLGERFRVKLSLPEWYTNQQCADFLLEYVLCQCKRHILNTNSSLFFHERLLMRSNPVLQCTMG